MRLLYESLRSVATFLALAPR